MATLLAKNADVVVTMDRQRRELKNAGLFVANSGTGFSPGFPSVGFPPGYPRSYGRVQTPCGSETKLRTN